MSVYEVRTSDHHDNQGDHSCPKDCEDFDYGQILCWPETDNGTLVEIGCPITPFTDHTRTFSRLCGDDGKWQHTDLSSCLDFPDSYYDYPNVTLQQIEFYFGVIETSRTVELICYFISWFSLLSALIIFASFRSLKCNRTKIHVHLFVALMARITTDIIHKISQIRKYNQEGNLRLVDKSPFLCGGLFAVNEYFTLCAFAWMFVEGLYLNTLISSSVFGRHNFIRYYIIAWVLPGPFVLMWVVFMILTAEGRCWPLHTQSLYYLILIEIPRDFLFILNSIFLLHIIYVLVTKLQNNNSCETQVIRKAVKAFFVLLPLLGISNLLWCLPQPHPGHHSAVIVIFYYGILFVYSSQGFAVAMLFCFLNKEVRVLIKRKWRIWVNFMDAPMRRTSVITSTSDVSTRSNGNHRLPRPGSSTFDSVTMPGSTTFETLA